MNKPVRLPTLKAVEDISRQMNNFAALKAVGESSRLALEIERVVVPTPKVLQALSVSVARTVQPLEDCFAKIENWESSIRQRMAAIDVPWAVTENVEVAGAGFARIARLHDVSTGVAPFGSRADEIFEAELGRPVPFDADVESKDRDIAAIEAGLNPEVVAFPRPVYPMVLFSAGFQLRIESAPRIVSDGGDSSGVLDSQHKTLFAEIENRLRMVVETELKKLVGDRWYQLRVSGEIWKGWEKRKEKDHQERGDSYPIVYYAYFTELPQIICQKDNWNDVFHQYFESKEDLQVSLQRLNAVRKALAHNRPLVKSDQLILFSEGCRILTALGHSGLRGGGNGR